jgi:hypothetical protein
MHRLLLLPAQVGAELGIVSTQVVALHRGADVALHRDQLAMFGHPDKPDLAGSEWWLLTGDNTLTPTTPPPP